MRFLLALLLAAAVFVAERYFGESTPSQSGSGQVSGSLTASGRAKLVDGDSLFLGSREVRMIGIDAPEGPQLCQRGGRSWRCGDASRQALANLIRNRDVVCKGQKEDRFGRLLGTCYVGDVNLNREMVASGLALAYGRYDTQQLEARKARIGLWADDVEFQNPKAWRRQNGRS